jgi:hypothetical protein
LRDGIPAAVVVVAAPAVVPAATDGKGMPLLQATNNQCRHLAMKMAADRVGNMLFWLAQHHLVQSAWGAAVSEAAGVKAAVSTSHAQPPGIAVLLKNKGSLKLPLFASCAVHLIFLGLLFMMKLVMPTTASDVLHSDPGFHPDLVDVRPAST